MRSRHPIASFYKGLFDLWLAANRSAPTASIRIISDMITALLGNNSPTEGVGHKPIELCTVMTDGTVEAHDVLRIAGDGFTETKFNIFDHAIDDVRNEPRWKAARDASIHLCEKCRQCKFMNACGGGYLPHRFSRKMVTTIHRSIATISMRCLRTCNPSWRAIFMSASRRQTHQRARDVARHPAGA
jgi:radical SAM protein with 4Fe4S-binding SPASM domain